MKKILLCFATLFLMFVTTGCTSMFSTNLYSINLNGKYGFIDIKGKEVVSPKFDAVIAGEDSDLYAVKLQGLWGFINTKGEMVIIPQYKDTKGFNNGLAFVTEDNYEGYINKQGQYVWKQQKQTKKAENKAKAAPKPAVKNDLADSILNEMGL